MNSWSLCIPYFVCHCHPYILLISMKSFYYYEQTLLNKLCCCSSDALSFLNSSVCPYNGLLIVFLKLPPPWLQHDVVVGNRPGTLEHLTSLCVLSLLQGNSSNSSLLQCIHTSQKSNPQSSVMCTIVYHRHTQPSLHM